MPSVLRPLAVGMTILFLAACASIVSDSKGPVTISSNPSAAAEITIADQSGREIYRGTTPTTVTLDASAGYFDGQKYKITFSKDG